MVDEIVSVYMAINSTDNIHMEREDDYFFSFPVEDVLTESLEKRLKEGDLKDEFWRKAKRILSDEFWAEPFYGFCNECEQD